MKKIGLLFAAITMMVLFFAVSANATYIKDGYYTYRIESDGAVVYDVHTSISGDVTIPSTINSYKVTKIGYEAFEACTNITSITIPDSVTYIDDRAFEFCEKLKSVTLPDSVTYIGRSAFIYCYALKSVTLPAGITKIGNYAFYYYDGLTSVLIGNSVASIGHNAFEMCYALDKNRGAAVKNERNMIDGYFEEHS